MSVKQCLTVRNTCVPWVGDFTFYWESIEAIVRQSSGSRVAIEWQSSGNRKTCTRGHKVEGCPRYIESMIIKSRNPRKKKKTPVNKAQSGTFLPKARFCPGMPAECLAFACEQPLARCCCRQAWAVIAYTELSCDFTHLSCDLTHLVNLGSAAMSRQRVGPFFSDG